MKKQWSYALITAAVFAFGLVGVAEVWAQNGVIGLQSTCIDAAPRRVYVMRGEAESDTNPRVLLPLPGLLNGVQFGQQPLDMTTSGPLTVLLHGLFAIAVNDNGGALVPAAPVNIRLAPNPNLPANINNAFHARFSPTGDRLALVSDGVLVIADILRDGNEKITGLTNPTVVANLFGIGSPSDSSFSGGGGFTGFPDFSPDGTQIVLSIYGDLWRLTLGADGHTLDSSQPLTRTGGDTEWYAAFSPDGSKLAYVGGRNRSQGVDSQSMKIFTLNVVTHEVNQVTSAGTKQGSLVDPESPAWSPDGQFLAFMAQGSQPPRNMYCPCVFVNYEIFMIRADGTGTPTKLTNTVGTSVELRSQWGW